MSARVNRRRKARARRRMVAWREAQRREAQRREAQRREAQRRTIDAAFDLRGFLGTIDWGHWGKL